MTTQNIFDLVDTWALSGGPYTSIKMNATDNDAASASLLMDLQVGAASKLKVGKNGGLALGGGSLNTNEFNTTTSGGIRFGSGIHGLFPLGSTQLHVIADGTTTIISSAATTRINAGNFVLGAADAATAQAKTLSVQSVVTGTSNTAGANFTINGSQGTGNAAGGSIIFQVAPLGSSGSAQNALATALTIASNKDATFGNDISCSGNMGLGGAIWSGNSSTTGYSNAGVGLINSSGGLILGSSKYIAWVNAANLIGTQDLILLRDAANTLALRNGTAAQLFRVYSTYNGTNDAYGAIGAAVNLDGTAGDANTLYIGSQKKGSPTALTKLAIQVDGTTRIDYNITNASQWWVTGALGSSNVITGNGVFSTADLRATAAGSIYWNTRSQLTSPADGNIVISNLAINDFGRLQFGGTTSSFPAIKRSSTTLQARLADDSAFASVQGKLTTDTAYTAGAPTATGYLVVYDSAGTAYKIPAVAV